MGYTLVDTLKYTNTNTGTTRWYVLAKIYIDWATSGNSVYNGKVELWMSNHGSTSSWFDAGDIFNFTINGGSTQFGSMSYTFGAKTTMPITSNWEGTNTVQLTDMTFTVPRGTTCSFYLTLSASGCWPNTLAANGIIYGSNRNYPYAYTACTSPTSITSSDLVDGYVSAALENINITWSGAENGTNNKITGYRIFYNLDSAPTTSTTTFIDTTVTEGTTSGSLAMNFTSTYLKKNRGKTIYIKIQAIGKQHSSYPAEISSAALALQINRLPSPAEIYENSIEVTDTSTIWTSTHTGQTTLVAYFEDKTTSYVDDDGQTCSLKYSVDSGDKQDYTAGTSLSFTVDISSSHTYSFYVYDGIEYSEISSYKISHNSKPTCSLTMAYGTKYTHTIGSIWTSNYDNQYYLNFTTSAFTVTPGTYGTIENGKGYLLYTINYRDLGSTEDYTSVSSRYYITQSTTSVPSFNIIDVLNNNNVNPISKDYYLSIQYYDYVEAGETTIVLGGSSLSTNLPVCYLPPAIQILSHDNYYSGGTWSSIRNNKIDTCVRLNYENDSAYTLSSIRYKIDTGQEVEFTGTRTVSGNSIHLFDLSFGYNKAVYFYLYFKNNVGETTICSSNYVIGTVLEIPINSVVTSNLSSISPYGEYDSSILSGSISIGITGINDLTTFLNNYTIDTSISSYSDLVKIYLVYNSTKILLNSAVSSFTASSNLLTATLQINSTFYGLISSTFTDKESNYTCSIKVEIANAFDTAFSKTESSNTGINFIYSPGALSSVLKITDNQATPQTLEYGSISYTLYLLEGETLKSDYSFSCYNNGTYQVILQRSTDGSYWDDYVSEKYVINTSYGFHSPYTKTGTLQKVIEEMTSDLTYYFRLKVVNITNSQNASTSSISISALKFIAGNLDIEKVTPYKDASSNPYIRLIYNINNLGYSSSAIGVSPLAISHEKVLYFNSSKSRTGATAMKTITTTEAIGPYTYEFADSYGSWSDAYAYMTFTTTLVHTITYGETTFIQTVIKTFTNPDYYMIFNSDNTPTVAYRQNRLGINTSNFGANDLLAIHGNSDYDEITLVNSEGTSMQVLLGECQLFGFSLDGGSSEKAISNMKLDGGDWT